MKSLKLPPLFGALLIAGLPTAASAYTFYEENFEDRPTAQPLADPLPLIYPDQSPSPLVIEANVFDAANVYLYNYFSFPAANVSGEGARFSAVNEDNQGGEEQGDKVLAVFSDYNNTAAHEAGDLVDANVFFEQFLEEADLGTTVTFQFDAKYGDLDLTPLTGPGGAAPAYTPEAEAFLKVLDPSAGFSVSIADLEDATTFPITWGTYVLTLTIPNDPDWIGRLLQAGFRTKTSNFQASTIFYDNLLLTSDRVDVGPPPIKILSLARNAGDDEFAITFEAEVGASYEIQKWNPVTEAWDYVFDLQAFSTEELLDDVDATEPTALYRIVKLES